MTLRDLVELATIGSTDPLDVELDLSGGIDIERYYRKGRVVIKIAPSVKDDDQRKLDILAAEAYRAVEALRRAAR